MKNTNKDIPLTIENLSGLEHEEHCITSAKSIALVLNGIAEKGNGGIHAGGR